MVCKAEQATHHPPLTMRIASHGGVVVAVQQPQSSQGRQNGRPAEMTATTEMPVAAWRRWSVCGPSPDHPLHSLHNLHNLHTPHI